MIKYLLPALLCIPALLPAQGPPPGGRGGRAPGTNDTGVNTANLKAPPSLTPDQIANIIKQLDQIEIQVQQKRNGTLGVALTKIRESANSEKAALDLYLDCYKLENFEKKNLKTSDFQAWKDQNVVRLSDPLFSQALKLQLEYLVFTIQAQEADDLGPVIPLLQSYLARVISAIQDSVKHTASGAVEMRDRPTPPGGRPGGRPNQPPLRPTNNNGVIGVLGQSVRNTEFSKAFQLDDFMRRADWVYEPLNIGGIYGAVIFPYYLEKNPSDLPALWDARINAEMSLRKATISENEFATLQKEQLPRLLWTKNQYLLSHDINPLLALADMLKTVRENPDHPDAKDWLETLRTLVNGPTPDVSPSQQAEATPAPAAP